MLLQDLAYDAAYNEGTLDDQLVRMALLISAADVRGSRGNLFPASILVESPSEPHPSTIDAYVQYEYQTRGLEFRQQLLDYFEQKWLIDQKPQERLIPVPQRQPGQLRAQTEALLEFGFIQSRIRALYKDAVLKHEDLVNSMIHKERELMDSHYVFYHGLAKYYYVIHAAVKELTKLFYPWATTLEDFHTIRTPRSPMFDKYQSVGDFLTHQLLTYGDVHDTPNAKAKALKNKYKQYAKSRINQILKDKIDWSVASYILSVNLALFGNIGYESKTECTFDYFVNDKERTISTNIDERVAFYEKLLRELPLSDVDQLSIDETGTSFIHQYAEKLIQLSDQMRAKVKEGIIYQIFIPKELVDQLGYLARNYGQPYGNMDAFNYLFNREIQDKKERQDLFIDLLEKDPTKALKTGPEDLLSSVLDMYQHNPQKLHNINRLQARLLFTNDILLNPSSGIKTFIYTAMPQETLQNYLDQINQITRDLFNEFLQYNKNKINENQNI